MSRWFEVFDNEEVQRLARNRRVRLVRGVAFAGVLSTLLLSYALGHPAGRIISLFGLAIVWLVAGLWWMRTDEHLRRIVWCVKVSDRRIEGYDYARRKAEIDWINVGAVRVTRSCLRIEGSGETVIEIPKIFPDFSTLSHRIVDYAEFYSVPIFIDGVRWDQIDIHELYPYIEGDETLGGSSSAGSSLA